MRNGTSFLIKKTNSAGQAGPPSLFERITRSGRLARLVAAGVVIVVAGAYLAAKSVFSADPDVDFKYIWFAGDMWNRGASPYSELFITEGADVFQNTNILRNWVYTPNWWPISAALALFEFETAVAIWRAINAVFVVLGAFLLFRTVKLAKPGVGAEVGALMFFAIATMQATPMGLAMGQSAIILFFGLSLLTYGLAARGNALQIAALVILALKPHIGVVAFAAMFVAPRYRLNAVIAAGICSLMSIPAIIIGGGVFEIATSYLEQISAYRLRGVNATPTLTGLPHALFDFAAVEMSTILALALAGICGAALVFLQGRRMAPAPESGTDAVAAIRFVSAISAATLLIAPLHTYDFVIAAPLLAFLCVQRVGLPYLLISFALLVIYRAGNLAELTGVSDSLSVSFPGSHLETFAGVLLFCGYFYHVLQSRTLRMPSAGAS